MAKLVSKTYGDALFALALESDSLTQFQNEAEVVTDSLKENEELQKLMHHPKIKKEEKIKLVEEIFKGRVSDEMVGFLRIIISKGRYESITDIFAYFMEKVKTYQGIGTAIITSAVALSDAQKEKLKARLLETTDFKEIEMQYQVDKTLLGGLVIRIGDRVADSSIKSKIYDLSKNLSKIQIG